MKIIFPLFFILMFLSTQIKAQCNGNLIFTTDSLGIDEEKMLFNLEFKITNDSVIVYPVKHPEADFLTCSIVEKQKCSWDSAKANGGFLYKLKF